ncbi:VanZ family protein [Lactiplantibacillus songbeiensis]|uniref:VanZ family protein n=1 Tax=Lactiplantibacillus songbeiensis TaxID=2559920 RepID=A0ABW4C1U7_9LACO|nr:VanZ family protein [Lactiplantibacillus songbeiensis]
MLAWLPFLLLSCFMIGLTIYLWQQPQSALKKLKQLALLGFIWVLTAFCYTPTAYNFGGNVTLQYIQWGPVKLILNPFRHLDLEFWLNVLLTMPLGFLIGWNKPTCTWRRLISLGLLTGLSLETGQFILDWLVNLQRWVEVDDVLTNWTGVIIGFAVYQLLHKRLRWSWL